MAWRRRERLQSGEASSHPRQRQHDVSHSRALNHATFRCSPAVLRGDLRLTLRMQTGDQEPSPVLNGNYVLASQASRATSDDERDEGAH